MTVLKCKDVPFSLEGSLMSLRWSLINSEGSAKQGHQKLRIRHFPANLQLRLATIVSEVKEGCLLRSCAFPWPN